VAAGSRLIRLAVFGHPVTHSLSPAIHRRFAAQTGLEIDYRAIDARPGNFLQKARELAADGGRGCNVTVPLKHAAWQAAARRSAAAKRAEAANTLVFEAIDDWLADNTDGRGLVRDLARHLPGGLAGRRILLAGAGGAAAGILVDLLQAAPAELHIVNRSPERAAALALRYADLGTIRSGGLASLASRGAFDLVVNATSAGHRGTCLDLAAGLFLPGGLCYDLNYGRSSQPLRQQCAVRGIAYRDGLGMLVEQAGLSFELWTGHAPDCAAVLAALRAEFDGD
jgi:shikimate dehydrogenase